MEQNVLQNRVTCVCRSLKLQAFPTICSFALSTCSSRILSAWPWKRPFRNLPASREHDAHATRTYRPRCKHPRHSFSLWPLKVCVYLWFGTGSTGHLFGNFSQIDTTCQVHFPRVNFQNIDTSLGKVRFCRKTTSYVFIWCWELDFTVNSTRS